MTISAAYDWVKNCACIADFYQSMDKQQVAALALSSAQKVLQEKVILKSTVGGGGGGGVTEQDCIELNCEIKKKWIKLDMKMMKIAFEIETERVLALDRGEPFSPPTYENDLDDLHMYQEPGSEIPDKQQCELLSSSDVILQGAAVDQSTSSVTVLKEVSNVVYLILENPFRNLSSRRLLCFHVHHALLWMRGRTYLSLQIFHLHSHSLKYTHCFEYHQYISTTSHLLLPLTLPLTLPLPLPLPLTPPHPVIFISYLPIRHYTKTSPSPKSF